MDSRRHMWIFHLKKVPEVNKVLIRDTDGIPKKKAGQLNKKSLCIHEKEEIIIKQIFKD